MGEIHLLTTTSGIICKWGRSVGMRGGCLLAGTLTVKNRTWKPVRRNPRLWSKQLKSIWWRNDFTTPKYCFQTFWGLQPPSPPFFTGLPSELLSSVMLNYNWFGRTSKKVGQSWWNQRKSEFECTHCVPLRFFSWHSVDDFFLFHGSQCSKI